ncbi:MAG: hypothetical protein H0T85_11335 [Geodermatophilaceae bacterium]|nr:hypothetical protein [Geodermatophilaceae bacterium]
MPDLQELLAEEAVRHQPGAVPDFAVVHGRARRRTRSRSLVSAVGTLATVALVAILVVSAVLTPEPTPVAAPVTVTAYDGSRLRFTYPQSWVLAEGSLSRHQNDGVLVALGTQIPDEYCDVMTDAGGNVTVCAVPHVELNAEGTFITWRSGFAFAPGAPGSGVPSTVRVLDGRPGRLWQGPAGSYCRSNGGRYEVMATISATPDASSETWTMQACLAAPYEQTEQQVLAMLDSLEITP